MCASVSICVVCMGATCTALWQYWNSFADFFPVFFFSICVRRNCFGFVERWLSYDLDWRLLSWRGPYRHRGHQGRHPHKSWRYCAVERGMATLPCKNHKLGRNICCAFTAHLILMDGTWFNFNCLRFFFLRSVSEGESDGRRQRQTTRVGLQAGNGAEKCRVRKQTWTSHCLKNNFLMCCSESCGCCRRAASGMQNAYEKYMTIPHFSLSLAPPLVSPSRLPMLQLFFFSFHFGLFLCWLQIYVHFRFVIHGGGTFLKYPRRLRSPGLMSVKTAVLGFPGASWRKKCFFMQI